VIIGNGDIASVLNDREGAIFFASGVSNSQCDDEKEYWREIELLLDTAYYHKDKTIFYFSSIAHGTRYYVHKRCVMETLIRGIFKNYNIIRIGNIDWGKNPNTFINYIKAKQAKGEPVEIRDEWKYMISKEQLLLLTDNLPLKGQNTISVFGEMKRVKDCL
jgi:UDP-2-acetamido-2,6-beta-L-arabino-hexul-4-ose reductase